MIKTTLYSSKSGRELHSYEGYDGDPILVHTTHANRYGHFAAGTRTGAGTTTIIAARGNDAIVLTDLIMTCDRVNGATATVNVTGGGNTVAIISADVTDSAVSLAIAFAGRWETWRAAQVDLVTVGAVTATVSLGYYRIPWNYARSYSKWNAER